MIHPRQDLKLLALNATAKFPLGGRADTVSITCAAQGNAWGTAVITPRWTNDVECSGPFFDFVAAELPTGVTNMGPGDDSITSISVKGKGWLVLVVTTAEGADETATVYVCDDSDRP